MAVPKHTIIATPADWNEGYDYKIAFEDTNRPTGSAQLLIKNIRGYSVNPTRTLVYEYLGLKPEDILAHLNLFDPNGERLDFKNPDHAKLMKQGVGSAVLERMIADALKHKAKIMHVFTNLRNKAMQNFLRKKEFTPYKEGSLIAEYYKLIEGMR